MDRAEVEAEAEAEVGDKGKDAENTNRENKTYGGKTPILEKVSRAIRAKTISMSTTVAHTVSSSAFYRAGVENLNQSEKKKHWLAVLEAFRSDQDNRPRVVCEHCLRAFPFWTQDAQEHVLRGECVPRPAEKTMKIVEVN